MEKIAVIYMGGTFGCVGEPLAPLPAPVFLQKLKHLCFAEQSHIDCFAAPTIKDSSELHCRDWLQLSLFIQSLCQQYQHFIVIHGTDTLNYAAAILHHIFARHIRLLLIGSQLPLLTTDGSQRRETTDAWENLQFAVEQIHCVPLGVYIAFHRQLFVANSGYKLHTQNYQAFLGQSPTAESVSSLALLPYLHDDWLQAAYRLRLINLYITPNTAQALAQQLALLQQDPPQIIILQAFGSGNLPQSAAVKNHLKALIDQGCWLILSSQVLYGGLSQQYAAGSWLADLGVVFDPHYSQADVFARAMLLYLRYGTCDNWQQYWQ